MTNPPDHIIADGKRYDHAPLLARRFGYTPQGFCRFLKRVARKGLMCGICLTMIANCQGSMYERR